MEAVEDVMREYIGSLNDPEIMKLFDALPSGKRLRSKLILKIAPNSPEAIALAAIIELIHAASLLHDDVIDDADIRRGLPSINATNGSKTSIMLGDILYSKAFFELSSMGEALARIVSAAVTELSVGELMDVWLAKSFNPDRQKYIEMIYKKTASLIEAAAAAAAVLAGKDKASYALYGKNLGLAFQIIDDILDITGNEATLGKPVLSDFKEGKTTLPYIYLYEALPQEEKGVLASLHNKELSHSESEWILLKMVQYGAIAKSQEEARRLGLEAIDAIRNDEAEDLRQIIAAMIERSC